ncbi:uncharacterized protein LOC134266851 [Saccostrea cucullata]|uniref:uncharacterized protein LOC134266851 n=1 Tax=Saccostrea cuccullata TaxID=36930 RepID=UPI002ED224CB
MFGQTFILIAALALTSAQSGLFDRTNMGERSYSDSRGMTSLRSLGSDLGLSDRLDMGRMDRQGMTSGMFDTLRGGEQGMSTLSSGLDLNRLSDTSDGLLRGSRYLDPLRSTGLDSLRTTDLTSGNGEFMQDFNRGVRMNLDNDLYNDLTGFPRRTLRRNSMSSNFMDNSDSSNSFPGRGRFMENFDSFPGRGRSMSLGRSMSRMGDNMNMMRSRGMEQGRRMGRRMGRRFGRRMQSYLPRSETTSTGSSRTMRGNNRRDESFRSGRTTSLF